MIKKAIVIVLLIFLSGCSVGLVRTNDPDRELQHANYIDSNEVSMKIIKSSTDPNRIRINWNLDKSDIKLSKPCRVKYQKFYFDFIGLIVVPGILPNGKTYSIWLDTGHPYYALTSGLTAVKIIWQFILWARTPQHWRIREFVICPLFRLVMQL